MNGDNVSNPKENNRQMIEVIANDRIGKKVRVKCFSTDTIYNLKQLIAAHIGTKPEKIKLQKNQINPEEILFSNEIENLLSEDDLQNYQNGKILFTELSEKIKTLSLTEIICELWYNLGNRYETLWCDTVSVYNEMYDYLFEIANQSDENGLGLSEFVDNLETLKANNERLSDMDIPLEKPDAVRLMTIHKSKGLEFPVVFVWVCVHADIRMMRISFSLMTKKFAFMLMMRVVKWRYLRK